jgi:hypothetical protein
MWDGGGSALPQRPVGLVRAYKHQVGSFDTIVKSLPKILARALTREGDALMASGPNIGCATEHQFRSHPGNLVKLTWGAEVQSLSQRQNLQV